MDYTKDSIPCPRCGAPSFNVKGHIVSACTCGKISTAQQVMQGGPLANFNAPTNPSMEPIDILKELVAVECTDDSGNLNSFGKPYFFKAITFLSKNGFCKLLDQKGYSVKAEWI